MHPLAELLATIGDITALSDEELADLRTRVAQACRDARNGDLSADVNDLIRQGVARVTEIAAEQTTRAEAAAAVVADADDALAGLDELDPPAAETPAEETAVAETPEGETPEADAPETPEAETPDTGGDVIDITPQADAGGAVDVPAADAPEAIAAAGPAPLRRDIVVPASHRPQPNRAQRRRRGFVASGEVPGIAAGHAFENMAEVTDAMIEKASALEGSTSTERHPVARLDYREELAHRIDSGMNPDAVTAAFEAIQDGRRALVAAGGIQGPPEPRYDQIVYGGMDRPVWSAMPGVAAPRGQIIYNDSPTLDDIVVDTTAGAIDTITNADDIADTSKTIQTISGVSATTVTVRARTLRFKNGNAFDRFLPERGRAFMHLGQVGYARHGDELLLQDIKTASTKYTNAIAELGAYRDLKATVLGTVAEIRDHIRDYTVPIHAIFPEFLPAMLAVDITRQLPGDNAFTVAEAQMRADIASWGIVPHFAQDSIRGRLLSTPSTSGGPPSTRSPVFDADVEWAIYPEGTFLTLDGGTLDLGIVRDDTLNTTNKFTTFFESWEAIARVGPYAYWVTSSLCPSGTSAAGTTSIVCSPSGS